jgi:hypothetical protein
MESGDAPVPRERGWRWPLLALLALWLMPLIPPLRVLAPIEQAHVLLIPALAACALVAWQAGGRFTLALLWVGLAAWMITQPTSATTMSYDRLARGWSLLLAACFGLACVLGAGRTFLARALTAIALAMVFALSIAFFTEGGGAQVTETVAAEISARNQISVSRLQQGLRASDWWRERSASSSQMAELPNVVEGQLETLAGYARVVFPALLALESLAILALAWALFQRLSRAAVGPQLARLREFRFNDQLVWGLIVGVTLVLVPTLSALRPAGWSLIVFFGGLFAVRGLGVVTWFLAPRRFAIILLIVFGLLAPPLLGAFALSVGLGDTWLDWRNRAIPPTT